MHCQRIKYIESSVLYSDPDVNKSVMTDEKKR
jgi:hypothetical protein